MSESDVPSPCLNICAIGEGNMCLGCMRTLDEIAGWRGFDNVRKNEVWDEIRKRRKEYSMPAPVSEDTQPDK